MLNDDTMGARLEVHGPNCEDVSSYTPKRVLCLGCMSTRAKGSFPPVGCAAKRAARRRRTIICGAQCTWSSLAVRLWAKCLGPARELVRRYRMSSVGAPLREPLRTTRSDRGLGGKAHAIAPDGRQRSGDQCALERQCRGVSLGLAMHANVCVDLIARNARALSE